MQAALDYLFTFHNKNQVLIKNCCHGNSRFHNMSAILAAFLDFSKFFFRKTATNFTEIGRKHLFLALNRKIIENRVKKKNLEQIFQKFYNFLF